MPENSPPKPSRTSSQQVQALEASCSALASADAAAYRSNSLQQALENRRTQRKFEDVTKLVFAIFKVDITAVMLVHEGKCIFKSTQGLEGESMVMDSSEACFCSYSVNQESNEVLVVEDAREDARYTITHLNMLLIQLLSSSNVQHCMQSTANQRTFTEHNAAQSEQLCVMQVC